MPSQRAEIGVTENKSMKNGYNLPSFPIKLQHSEFPDNKEKAEAFVNSFCKNSSTSSLDEEDLKKQKASRNKIGILRTRPHRFTLS